ncbi:MAG: TonB C-terminal domain-containing protein, partial [Gammaproteobacteria bacterium]
MPRTGTTLRSFMYSLMLHGVALALFVISVEFTPETLFPRASETRIVNAVTIDEKQVQAELDRLQDIEQAKARRQEELERKLAEIEKKTAAVEKQRKTEEKRLADLAKKKEQERKEREEEQKKLAEVKKQAQELEQQRKLEVERKRKEQEEQKRAEDEEALQRQLVEEQRRLDAASLREELRVVAEYVARIQNAVKQQFNLTGLPPGLSNAMRIRTIPGGEVVQATITRSSGNGVFDSRAEIAVRRAS